MKEIKVQPEGLGNLKDLIRIAHLSIFVGEPIAKFLIQLLRFNKTSKLYSELVNKKGEGFITALLNILGIKYEIDTSELKRIPEKGNFITISNHPLGGIDAMLLIKIVTSVRKDYKVIGDLLLEQIEPIKEYFFSVNPIPIVVGTSKQSKYSFSKLKNAYYYLHSEAGLGVFPAGEKSSFNIDILADSEWQLSVLRFIKNAHVPVIPIYFQVNNKFVDFFGRFSSVLRPFFNRKNNIIKIRIGNPISVKEQMGFKDISQFGRYLRAKTYALGTSIEVKKFFSPIIRLKREEEIIPSIQPKILQDEISRLIDNYLLFRSNNYLVLCPPAMAMSNDLLTEIGRLRELTFRQVGEGTNKSYDIDEYDLHYYHLIVWDDEKKQIIGAYRAGKGKDIFNQYSINGFYIHSLFRINSKFFPILDKSIELGRSFIVKDYQKKPLSLYLLWKGILYFLIKNPEYRYLIGPVSITKELSRFSKDLIIEFIKLNCYNNELAKFVKPRKKYRPQLGGNNKVDKEIIIKNTNNDIDKLDKFISDIEPKCRLPVLLKKYIGLNAKIIGFNVDPKFNNCLDGLILLDLFDVPTKIIESLSKEINDATIIERFNIIEN